MTIPQFLTVRGALTVARLIVQRQHELATSQALRRHYQKSLDQIDAAGRVLDKVGSNGEVTTRDGQRAEVLQ